MQKIDGALFKNYIALQGLYCIFKALLASKSWQKTTFSSIKFLFNPLSANPQNGQTPSNNSLAKAFEHISHLGLVFLFLTLSK